MFKREKKRKPKEIRKRLRLYCSSYMMHAHQAGLRDSRALHQVATSETSKELGMKA